MNTSRKAMEWFFCFSVVNLMLGCLLFKQFKNLMNLVLRNLRKNKDIVITKRDKGNGVVILDRKVCNKPLEAIISDTCKFEKLNEDPALKREASLQLFLRMLKQETCLIKLKMISCILLVHLLLVSMVLLWYSPFPKTSSDCFVYTYF